MCYRFRFLPPLEDKELIKMIDRNDPRTIEYRDSMFKAIPKPKEMSSFETYCRYGKG